MNSLTNKDEGTIAKIYYTISEKNYKIHISYTVMKHRSKCFYGYLILIGSFIFL